jgi:hypothetical protein
MSAPHHSLSDIPALDAYQPPVEQNTMNLDIEAYLRCEDLAENAGSIAATSFAPDDISLMRAARCMAAKIRGIEASEGPLTAAAKRTHRVTGSALTYVIQQCSTRVRDFSDDQYETLGQFRDLIVAFVVQRIKRSSSLLLYERMRGEYWTDRLQEGVLCCVEQLWEVSSISGLINPDSDLETVIPVLNTMATIYTVSWFGMIDMQRVDVMTIDSAMNNLSGYTLKLLNK